MSIDYQDEQQDRQDNYDAAQGVEDQQDHGAPRQETQTERLPEPEDAPEPIQMSPQDEARSKIAARFRRDGDPRPFDGDMSNPANLYGDVSADDQTPDDSAEPGVPQHAAPTPAPTKRKIKVRGQELELTDDELIERASKVTAADSYLEEARQMLEEAKRVKAERAGHDPHRPEGQNNAQEDVQDRDPRQQQQHPAERLKSVVEQIQYGDPGEAANNLGQLIAEEARRQANEGHLQRLRNNDLAISQKALKDFTAANPELSNDPDASVMIENFIYREYAREIKAMGMDPQKIPQNPAQLAEWHRFYRVHGHNVSKAADILQRGKAYVEGKLNRGQQQQQKPAPRSETPARIDVNVDRTARRQALPTQPSRTSAPRPSQSPQAQPSTRSDVVAEMRRARGQVQF